MPTKELQKSIKQYLRMMDDSKDTRYVAKFCVLGDKGQINAIVYMDGPDWCGTGGCNTMIFAPDAGSWRIIGNVTITRPPIRVLAETSHGMRAIGVWVEGGGIHPGYEAELFFDGTGYPRNPSVPPARKAPEGIKGELLIQAGAATEPLNDP